MKLDVGRFILSVVLGMAASSETVIAAGPDDPDCPQVNCNSYESPLTFWQQLRCRNAEGLREASEWPPEIERVMVYTGKPAQDALQIADLEARPYLRAIGHARFILRDTGKPATSQAIFLENCLVSISGHSAEGIRGSRESASSLGTAVGQPVDLEFKALKEDIKIMGRIVFNGREQGETRLPMNARKLANDFKEAMVDQALVKLDPETCQRVVDSGIDPAILNTNEPDIENGFETDSQFYSASFLNPSTIENLTPIFGFSSRTNTHVIERCPLVRSMGTNEVKETKSAYLIFSNCSTISGFSNSPFFRVRRVNGEDRMEVIGSNQGGPGGDALKQLKDRFPNQIEIKQGKNGSRQFGVLNSELNPNPGRSESVYRANVVFPFVNLPRIFGLEQMESLGVPKPGFFDSDSASL